MNKVMLLAAATLAGLLSSAAFAAEPIVSTLEAYRVVTDVNGEETFASANQVKPGELIEYRLLYTNKGVKTVNDLVVNGPVPKGTSYVGASAKTSVKHQLLYSYDSAKTWVAKPPKRTVRDATGKPIEQDAPVEEITNLEWLDKEPLVAGAEQRFVYRVRVQELPR